MTYEKKILATGDTIIVRFNDDGSESFIPQDLENSDYQAYLKSLEA